MLARMRRFDFKRSPVLALSLLFACGGQPADRAAPSAPAPATPPAATPATSAPAEPAPAAEPAPPAHARAEPKAEPREKPAAPKAASEEPEKPRASSSARTQSSLETEKLNRAHAVPSPVPAEPIVAAPEPVAPAPAPAPAPPPPAAKPAAGRVVVPSTSRLHVEVPAGLQRWLDADTRMQPWLNKVIPVIDKCYGDVLESNANASGTITFRVTMHKDARPDPDIQSLPGQLSGVVACATGQLMRARMPLFTGTEGESYSVRVKFGE